MFSLVLSEVVEVVLGGGGRACGLLDVVAFDSVAEIVGGLQVREGERTERDGAHLGSQDQQEIRNGDEKLHHTRQRIEYSTCPRVRIHNSMVSLS